MRLFIIFIILIFQISCYNENSKISSDEIMPEILNDYPSKIDSIVNNNIKSKVTDDTYEIIEYSVVHPVKQENRFSDNNEKNEEKQVIDTTMILVNVKFSHSDKMEELIYFFDSNGKYLTMMPVNDETFIKVDWKSLNHIIGVKYSYDW